MTDQLTGLESGGITINITSNERVKWLTWERGV